MSISRFGRADSGATRWVCGAAIALACAAIARPGLERSEPRSAAAVPATVASLNLARALNGVAEARVIEAKLEGLRAEATAYHASNKAQIDRLQAEIDALPPDSPLHEEKQIELFTLGSTVNAMLKVKADLLAREESLEYKRMYEKVIAAASDYAEANGIDFILLDDTDLTVEAGDPNQTFAQLFTRKVIYGSPARDITAELITRMDNAFNQ